MTHKRQDDFGAKATLTVGDRSLVYYRLNKLEEDGIAAVSKLPFSIKVLLEAMLRNNDGFAVTKQDVENMARWNAANPEKIEVPFKPARVILQDFTGVPAVVDLAAMRAAMAQQGGDPQRINPLVPVDLVIDHSVQIDQFGSKMALFFNAEREFERNAERYEFLKWGQQAFDNFSVVPPETGIVHQVNLEYLAKVVQVFTEEGELVALPDSLVGTDSHTTMINGLGVVGWGVGGIEAEAVMLGQPIYMLLPEVIGFKVTGQLPEGATATDLALTVTELLRKKGVVGKFVEFYGPGVANMALSDRATIANMAPEYGATMGFFPVDQETIHFLRSTGRSDELADLVEAYSKAQGLFLDANSPEAEYTDTVHLDLSTIVPSVAGPKRPQDRVELQNTKASFQKSLTAPIAERGFALSTEKAENTATVQNNGHSATIGHGAVVIASITSCTNTSNPSVMLGAGLLAKKAVEKGLTVAPYVKTSLAPGSRVVSSYLEQAELIEPLEALGFHVVGYGCTTCIGNSGPLPEPVAAAVQEGELVAAAVLSGNRNFEGRINPLVKAAYLASPPLVVAYALAGTINLDLATEPLGNDKEGNPVYLRDIWPSQSEIQETVRKAIKPEMFTQQYGNVFAGSDAWKRVQAPTGNIYAWNNDSTYIQHPPFFQDLQPEPAPIGDITGARVLALLGDSVTTDHISPAGSIAKNSPAAKYLIDNGVDPQDFNSYGARRGNHEVMMRGTFANIRLKNLLLNGVEGGYTLYFPTGEQQSIYDASMAYQASGTPLVILAGKEYGTGSSRDWAAKGTYLLGVKVVIAESYERIHRSNLVGMGVLPLQYRAGESAASLGLKGDESFSVEGINDDLQARSELTVRAVRPDGSELSFQAVVRIDTPVEVEYYKNGGILHTVLRQLAKTA
ncbi:MAG TPA: aconitate hydratase AcnA [Herpetosiphon sp.]|uniref:Aconitate hydratase n=1 Tax=Herpetosiphon aurantiacus (strain ATCC 23779 / DSM 785 / 114-95) TaxID=316274 RepID=A9AWH8_HERA2|nr:aconitate hydratase AcnA [Herpetosiphon sp.]ABX06737.1 aconitate hydratase 1 [Herpetosiphon aurantiacus DSM 785]HBW48542.1 aconitate hydratase AcnA [Herpetosiphon sp.]